MKVYVVNAFSGQQFGGNPAAIVPLDNWLPDEQMQKMAAQHNLAETAFIIPRGKDYEIRWFTPTIEVDLCGHATLASAHVFYHHLAHAGETILFHSRSGPLPVRREENGKLTLDFPVNPPEPTSPLPEVENGLHARPVALFTSRFDHLALFENQSDIEQLVPDFRILSQIKSRGLIATARGRESDFVSRCFYPQSGIDEDPVTGSSFTVLAPFWAGKLGKNKMTAIQLSARRGEVDCELSGNRVLITGNARTYLVGEILPG